MSPYLDNLPSPVSFLQVHLVTRRWEGGHIVIDIPQFDSHLSRRSLWTRVIFLRHQYLQQ